MEEIVTELDLTVHADAQFSGSFSAGSSSAGRGAAITAAIKNNINVGNDEDGDRGDAKRAVQTRAAGKLLVDCMLELLLNMAGVHLTGDRSPLLPKLAGRSARELAVVALVLTHWQTRDKVTPAVSMIFLDAYCKSSTQRDSVKSLSNLSI
jgi:hypothetical protein